MTEDTRWTRLANNLGGDIALTSLYYAIDFFCRSTFTEKAEGVVEFHQIRLELFEDGSTILEDAANDMQRLVRLDSYIFFVKRLWLQLMNSYLQLQKTDHVFYEKLKKYVPKIQPLALFITFINLTKREQSKIVEQKDFDYFWDKYYAFWADREKGTLRKKYEVLSTDIVQRVADEILKKSNLESFESKKDASSSQATKVRKKKRKKPPRKERNNLYAETFVACVLEREDKGWPTGNELENFSDGLLEPSSWTRFLAKASNLRLIEAKIWEHKGPKFEKLAHAESILNRKIQRAERQHKFAKRKDVLLDEKTKDTPFSTESHSFEEVEFAVLTDAELDKEILSVYPNFSSNKIKSMSRKDKLALLLQN